MTARPIRINQPVIGSNNTISIPRPNPMKHTPNVFFKNPFIFTSNSLLILYVFFFLLLPFDKITYCLYNREGGKNMTKNDIKEFIDILRKTYPEAKCSLDFKTPFQLVVAVCLSAQCTDERVNLTTPALFKRCKTIEDFVNIPLEELETLIHPCGFYKNKAKNIKKCAKQILDEFEGKVPQDMESLMKLAGVGRKSANVIMLEVFGIAKRYCGRYSLQTYFQSNWFISRKRP